MAGACGGTGASDGPNGGTCAFCRTGVPCDATVGCLDCTADNQCPGSSRPFCVRGFCVACRNDGDCMAGTVCQSFSYTCGVPCASAASCKMPYAPICNTQTGQCVGCNSTSDCPQSRPLCDLVRQQCVACLSNMDCAATAPKCFRGACAQCVSNADCPPATFFCEPGTLRCRTGCKGDNDCPSTTPKCDPRAECVQCLMSADCKSKDAPLCSDASYTCVQCVKDADCPTTAPQCREGRCQ